MSFGWKKYLDDYEENKNGQYVYIGKYYRIFLEKEALRRVRIAYSVLAAAMVILFILAGLNEYASSRTWYVVLPYAASLIPVGFLVMDSFRICRAPERMTRKQYNESVLQHRRSCIAMLLLALAATVGDVVFLLTACPAPLRGQEIVFLVCCAGMAMGAGLWLWLSGKVPSGPEAKG